MAFSRVKRFSHWISTPLYNKAACSDLTEKRKWFQSNICLMHFNSYCSTLDSKWQTEHAACTVLLKLLAIKHQQQSYFCQLLEEEDQTFKCWLISRVEQLAVQNVYGGAVDTKEAELLGRILYNLRLEEGTCEQRGV